MNEVLKKIDAEIENCRVKNLSAPTIQFVNIAKGLVIAKGLILAEQKEPCKWTLTDDDSNSWQCNKCDALWVLESGSPKDNDMDYCPKCGRAINQSPGEPKPLTKGDKIRESNESLANELSFGDKCGFCVQCNKWISDGCDMKCKENILAYLNQPQEGE